MEALSDFTVLFPEGNTECFLDTSLKDVSLQLQQRGYSISQRPLLVTDEGSGLKLLYLDHYFEQFASGFLSYSKLKADCWCHGLYRNVTRLKTQQDDEVEPESLWLLRHNELMLINEDNFITSDFNVAKKLFRKIG